MKKHLNRSARRAAQWQAEMDREMLFCEEPQTPGALVAVAYIAVWLLVVAVVASLGGLILEILK